MNPLPSYRTGPAADKAGSDGSRDRCAFMRTCILLGRGAATVADQVGRLIESSPRFLIFLEPTPLPPFQQRFSINSHLPCHSSPTHAFASKSRHQDLPLESEFGLSASGYYRRRSQLLQSQSSSRSNPPLKMRVAHPMGVVVPITTGNVAGPIEHRNGKVEVSFGLPRSHRGPAHAQTFSDLLHAQTLSIEGFHKNPGIRVQSPTIWLEGRQLFHGHRPSRSTEL